MKRTRHFREAMRQSPSLRAVLMKYVQAFMVQTAHTAIANAREADIEAISVDVRLWPICMVRPCVAREFVDSAVAVLH